MKGEGDRQTLIEWFYFYLFIILGAEDACQEEACSYWAAQEGGEVGCSRWFLALGGWLETPGVTVHKKDTRQRAKFHSPTSAPPEQQGTGPAPGAPRSLGCSIISRWSPAHPYICAALCAWSDPGEGQAVPDQGSLEPLSHWASLQAVPSSPAQRCARQPQPKTEFPPLSASSIWARAVRTIILHLLSQNRTGALPCWSKHGQEQGLDDFCWQGLWHRQCLPWWAVRAWRSGALSNGKVNNHGNKRVKEERKKTHEVFFFPHWHVNKFIVVSVFSEKNGFLLGNKPRKIENCQSRGVFSQIYYFYMLTHLHAQNTIHFKREFHMEKLLLNHFSVNHLRSKLGDLVYLMFWLTDESFWSSSASNASSLTLLKEINSGKKKKKRCEK